MRYFSYNELSDDLVSNEVITVSEEDIYKSYWPFWYKKMCDKFGKEYVDSTYNFEDCLDDWYIVNWAWSVQD